MRALALLLPVPLLLLAASRRSRSSSNSASSPGPRSLPSSPGGSSAPFSDARRLHTLDATVPEARAQFEALIQEAARRGFKTQIISAVRTCAEQRAVNPKAPRSWHPLGRAIDVEFPGATVADYTALGEWWEARGGVWGGRWIEQYPVAPCGPLGAAGDVCHFQWTRGLTADLVWQGGTCEDVSARMLRKDGSAWSPVEGWLA